LISAIGGIYGYYLSHLKFQDEQQRREERKQAWEDTKATVKGAYDNWMGKGETTAASTETETDEPSSDKNHVEETEALLYSSVEAAKSKAESLKQRALEAVSKHKPIKEE